MAKNYGVDFTESAKDSTKDSTPEPTKKPKPEMEDSDIQPNPKLIPKSGHCAWVLTDDSDGYPSGWVNEDMRVLPGDTKTSVRTKFWHGKQGCNDQVFETYHSWEGLEEMLYKNDMYTFTVVFSWENIGTADCASLAMAGGTTTLVGEDFSIQAGMSNINIRTNPTGTQSAEAIKYIPDGEEGDIMTLTQHMSTGSYGKNIRWHYEYVCNRWDW